LITAVERETRIDAALVEKDYWITPALWALHRLPPSEIPARTLADDMLAQEDVAALSSADDPSLVLDDPSKRDAVARAYARIAPMFWGPRIPLDDACGTLRDWVAGMGG
jgi:hypothetical protein